MAKKASSGTVKHTVRKPRKRYWKTLPPGDGPLLGADRQLQAFCGERVPPFHSIAQLRPVVLRELQRLIKEEPLKVACVIRELVQYEVKLKTGQAGAILWADAIEVARNLTKNHETLEKWRKKLGIPTWGSEPKPEDLGTLLEEIAEAVVRYYGHTGLDHVSVRCTIADLVSRIEDGSLSRGLRVSSQEKLHHLYKLAVPLVKPRTVLLDKLKSDIQRLRLVIASVKRGRGTRGHSWNQRDLDNYTERVKARVIERIPEITPPEVTGVDFNQSPRDIAIQIVALGLTPPIKASTLRQMLKQKQSPRIPISVLSHLRKP